MSTVSLPGELLCAFSAWAYGTVPLVIVMFDGNEIGQWLLQFYCREKLQREFVVYVRGNHDESWQCATG